MKFAMLTCGGGEGDILDKAILHRNKLYILFIKQIMGKNKSQGTEAHISI